MKPYTATGPARLTVWPVDALAHTCADMKGPRLAAQRQRMRAAELR
jgi:hypothetical protein